MSIYIVLLKEIQNEKKISINTTHTPREIIITDLNGLIIRVLDLSGSRNQPNDYTIDVSHLSSGVYLVTLKTDKQQSTRRFIKI